jgi:hypothetical protein
MLKLLLNAVAVCAAYDLGPLEPGEHLPDGLLPPLEYINVPTGDVKAKVKKFVTTIPGELREMFRVSHLKVRVKEGKIVYQNGQDPLKYYTNNKYFTYAKQHI